MSYKFLIYNIYIYIPVFDNYFHNSQSLLLNTIFFQNTETENCDLQKRLDQTTADTLKVKKEAELELCNLREQLTKHETQLTAMAKAMAASTPSIPTGPIPELIRAQELAQVRLFFPNPCNMY